MSYEIKKLFRYSRTDPTTPPPPHTHTHDPLQAEGSSCEGDNWAQNPTDEGVGSNYSPLLLQISINIYKYTYIYVHLVYTYSRGKGILFTVYLLSHVCRVRLKGTVARDLRPQLFCWAPYAQTKTVFANFSVFAKIFVYKV